jgi:hypothetical protein
MDACLASRRFYLARALTPSHKTTPLSGLWPKLTRIGAKLVETWRHVYILFGQDGYQRVAIRLSTNLRPALFLTLVALQYLSL